MVDIKTVEVNEVGLVSLERSKRAKRISITIKPFRGIRVAVPYRSSFEKAEEFTYSHRAWIRKHLKRVKQYESKYHENASKVDKIDRGKAKTILVNRLRYLAENYRYPYNRVFIRNQKTRWGSCSAKNNISLNMKLVMLPDALVDYIILHELVHTRKKNHSKSFWSEVDKLVDNSKQLRSRLRQYGIELY